MYVCLYVESLNQQFYIFKQQEDKTKKKPKKPTNKKSQQKHTPQKQNH